MDDDHQAARKALQKAFDGMQALLEEVSGADTQEQLLRGSAMLHESLAAGHKVLSCGNGGSMADAIHFAEELTGRFRGDRPPMAALALSDPGYLSCVGNDFGYSEVFARGVEGLGSPGDVLLALSTSGNSANVCRAAEAATGQGMQVLALTGKDGGRLAQLATLELRVPHFGYADRIQEVHIKFLHLLIQDLERRFGFGI